jgi:hypothetical protein
MLRAWSGNWSNSWAASSPALAIVYCESRVTTLRHQGGLQQRPGRGSSDYGAHSVAGDLPIPFQWRGT